MEGARAAARERHEESGKLGARARSHRAGRAARPTPPAANCARKQGSRTDRLYSDHGESVLSLEDRHRAARLVFAAIVGSGRVTLGEEHDRLEWLPVTAARKRLTWPRDAESLGLARQLLRSGDAGVVEDVLRTENRSPSNRAQLLTVARYPFSVTFLPARCSCSADLRVSAAHSASPAPTSPGSPRSRDAAARPSSPRPSRRPSRRRPTFTPANTVAWYVMRTPSSSTVVALVTSFWSTMLCVWL